MKNIQISPLTRGRGSGKPDLALQRFFEVMPLKHERVYCAMDNTELPNKELERPWSEN